MRKNKLLNGFSLAEVLMVLFIVGFIYLITALGFSGIFADTKTGKFKKAYTSIENTIGYLINNENLYNSGKGFMDANPIKLESGETLGISETSKFRDSFRYYVGAIKDNLDCELYNGKSETGCFQSDDGIVWGIPDTNFKDINTIEVNDYDNTKIKAVPITVYLEFKQVSTLKNDAFVAAVTYDGRIKILDNFSNIDCEKESRAVQCNIEKYIKSNSIEHDEETVKKYQSINLKKEENDDENNNETKNK